MMDEQKKMRLAALEKKVSRTPHEEEVYDTLVALDEKIKSHAPQVEVDAANKAVVDAEAKAKA